MTAARRPSTSKSPSTSPSSWQRRVLAARYLDCLLGDLPTLLLLLVQAPVIGWLCTLVWRSVQSDTPSLYFVMCLASIWFGCIGSCRELVKERAIIERERLLGVTARAVVLSKARVLFGLGALQALLLQGAIEWRMALRGPYLVETAILVLATWCGVGLGLWLSALSAREDRAVGAVPLLLLPQVLFSEVMLPRKYFTQTVAVVEKIMPLRWAYRAFLDGAAVDPSWLAVAGSAAALLLETTIFLVLAILALKSSSWEL